MVKALSLNYIMLNPLMNYYNIKNSTAHACRIIYNTEDHRVSILLDQYMIILRGSCPHVIECHSYVTCVAKSIAYLQRMGVVIEHFKSLLLAFGKVCVAF